MNKRQNIIVRNIIFSNGTDDTFKINQNTHHIWVDHCDFTKAEDGLFDITRQSSFITISWNKFYVVVEGNYFENVPHPTHAGYQEESGPGDLVERNNAYVNSGTPETRGTAFDPKAAYPYIVEDPMTLPVLLRCKAGAGVIDPMAVVK